MAKNFCVNAIQNRVCNDRQLINERRPADQEDYLLDKKKHSVSVRLLITMIVYAVVLVTLTHIPQDRMPSMLDGFHIDKLLHAGAYAGLTALLMLSVGLNRSWMYYVAAFLLILIIAGIDEYTQVYVGRTSSVFDWLADALGSIAVFITLLKCTIKSKKGSCEISVQLEG